MRASLGRIRFKSVYDAMRDNGIEYSENDKTAALVWHDSIKDIDYFKYLQPWQMVNRIPNINVLCRKASFARLIQRISPIFPNLFSFVPKSYILPFRSADFLRAVAKAKRRFIVKPDCGSLGQGITIVEPGQEYAPEDILAVAQDYIDSLLLDNTKFDLRIYVLITSIDPLEIYVHRDGLARFCAEQDGSRSMYSKLTNVGLNKDKVVEEFSEISRLISDVFPRLEKELGMDIKDLWGQIDEVVVLSILSAYDILKKGVEWQCPSVGYSRCFQILGFDILLDREFKPHVLEVNYRPSLEYHRGRERRMKVQMIREALQIAAPLQYVQAAVDSRKWGWDNESWNRFISQSPQILESIKTAKENALKRSKFVQVFPCLDQDRLVWEEVMKAVQLLPVEIMPGFNRPAQAVPGGEA